MKDVSSKTNSLRSARAEASLKCMPSTIAAILAGTVPKADPVGVAKVAGIQAAKNTSLLIPYCHPVPIDFVSVDIALGESSIRVTSLVKAVWKTGVEMEALTAASAAALTLYDMLKPIDKGMTIDRVALLEKHGGKSDFAQKGISIKAGILVASDRGAAGVQKDLSGALLRERLVTLGVEVDDPVIVPDDAAKIEQQLKHMCDDLSLDLVITSGGTGIGPRDVTPEAMANVIERSLPGIDEAVRVHGQERTRYAMLSRGHSGVRGKTLIINLPGSPRGVEESLDVLLPWVLHSFDVMRGGGH